MLLYISYSNAQTGETELYLELDKTEKELNINYNKLKGILNFIDRNALIISHKDWLKYRESNCKFKSHKDSEGGVIANKMFIDCKIISAKQRIKELKDLTIEFESERTIIESKHCFLKDVIKKDERYFIVADYVDFLTNEKAVEKAKEQGKSEYDISEKGDTIHFVYSDYYISNINPKLRTLELSEQTKIELLDFSQNANESGYKIVSAKELIEQFENHPLVILKFENGVIKEIKEQFTP